MAAVRCAARRLGGSLLQRTQAAITSPAVSEERRRQFLPRLVHTRMNPPATLDEVLLEIERMKEVLYDRITKAEMLGGTDSTNRQLRKSLSAQIKPRPDDPQWRKIRGWKRFGDVVRTGRDFVSTLLGCAVLLECQSRNHARKRLARDVNREAVSVEEEVALASSRTKNDVGNVYDLLATS